MERKSPSQEINTLDYPWGQIVSEDSPNLRKCDQWGHFHCDGSLSRDVATARETIVKTNRSSSSCKIDYQLQRCNATIASDSCPSKPHETLLQERTNDIQQSNLHSVKMPDTKPQVNPSASTQTGNIEVLNHSWWTTIYNWIFSNSSLGTMFAMLMVGDDMHSPPSPNRGPTIYLTSPGGHERRLSPLSPPKSPTRSLRESIERIKAFPKIPKRQFTTPEKSPEKKQPLGARNHQTSIHSPAATSTSVTPPCGGFRLLSPNKVFHLQRDPFAIPETFEPVPSTRQPFDFSEEPKVVLFPSLMFKLAPTPQDGDKDASQPSSNKDPSQSSSDKDANQPSSDKDASRPSSNKDASRPSSDKYVGQPSSNEDANQSFSNKDANKSSSDKDANQPSSDFSHQQEPSEPGVAENNSSPENDNRLPVSQSNPKRELFPSHSTGDAEGKVGSKNLDELYKNSQLNESDTLQKSIQDAVKEFAKVYGQYTGNLENKIAKGVQKMEEFIVKVRRTIVRVTDIGAIVSTMHLPDEVTDAMARINKAINQLKIIMEKLDATSMLGYLAFVNLKCRHLSTYQGGKESSTIDNLHALRTGTKELRDMLAEVTKLVDSYRTDKKYVEKHVFEESKAVYSKTVEYS